MSSSQKSGINSSCYPNVTPRHMMNIFRMSLIYILR
jgi:hypothetical protein